MTDSLVTELINTKNENERLSEEIKNKEEENERTKLHCFIDTLNTKIGEGIAKKNEIENHKNITIKLQIPSNRILSIDRGKSAVNCLCCSKTCLYPSYISEDSDLVSSPIMNSNGYCSVCGCHWSVHYNMPFRIESREIEEELNYEDFLKKYGNNNYTKTVKLPKIEKIALERGVNAIYCTKCMKTCTENSPFSTDDELPYAEIIDTKGYCNVCGCHHSNHHIKNIIFKVCDVEQKISFKRDLKIYEDKKSKLQAFENEYDQIWNKISYYLTASKECVDNLIKIGNVSEALKNFDDIKHQIEGEMTSFQPGWQDRVKSLCELLDKMLIEIA